MFFLPCFRNLQILPISPAHVNTRLPSCYRLLLNSAIAPLLLRMPRVVRILHQRGVLTHSTGSTTMQQRHATVHLVAHSTWTLSGHLNISPTQIWTVKTTPLLSPWQMTSSGRIGAGTFATVNRRHLTAAIKHTSSVAILVLKSVK